MKKKITNKPTVSKILFKPIVRLVDNYICFSINIPWIPFYNCLKNNN